MYNREESKGGNTWMRLEERVREWAGYKKANALPPLRAPNAGTFHGFPSCPCQRPKSTKTQSTYTRGWRAEGWVVCR